MKKILLLFFSMILLFTRCNNKEDIHTLFNFSLEEIKSIDIYQMSSARIFLVKEVLDKTDIENIYYSFDKIDLTDDESKLLNTVIGLSVYTFKYCLAGCFDVYTLTRTDTTISQTD